MERYQPLIDTRWFEPACDERPPNTRLVNTDNVSWYFAAVEEARKLQTQITTVDLDFPG